MNNKEILINNDWKIAHRDDGQSFIGVPYKYENKIEVGWILGPMNRGTAEFLFEAILLKQKEEKIKLCQNQ